MKDILLDENFDLSIQNGDFDIGESKTQDVAIILSLNQGNLKSAPLMGPNLVQKMKSKSNDLSLKKAVKISLEMDGKDYDQIKNSINIDGKG